MRNTDGTLRYTRRGAADFGSFDLVNRSVTVGVGVAKRNALATRGPVAAGSTLLGLRGSSSVSLGAAGVATSTAISDATGGGRTFTLEGCAAF